MQFSFDTYTFLIILAIDIIFLFLIWKHFAFSKPSKIILTGLLALASIKGSIELDFLQIQDDLDLTLYILIIIITVFLVYKNKKTDQSNDSKNYTLYSEKILEILTQANFDDYAKNSLQELSKKLQLTLSEQQMILQNAFKNYIEMFIVDSKLNPNDLDKIITIARFFNLNNVTNIIDNRQLHIWTSNWLIEETNQLQQLPVAVNSLILKLGEIMLWWSPAKINKYEQPEDSKTKLVPAVSIQVTKGMLYKDGFINIKATKSPYLKTVEIGNIYFTNYKIIFKSNKTSFNIEYSSLEKTEITEAGLTLHISESEEPLYLELDNYEFPCTIIAFIMNNPEFEISPPNFAQIKTRTIIN